MSSTNFQQNPYAPPQPFAVPVENNPPVATPIEVSLPLPIQDFRLARTVATSMSRKGKIALTLFAVPVLAIGMTFELGPEVALGVRVVAGLIGAALVMTGMFGLRYLSRFFGGNAQCEMLNQQRRVFSEDGVRVESTNGQGEFSWNNYRGYRRYGEVIALFHAQAAPVIQFEPVSAAQFANRDDWTRLLDLIARKLPEN